MQTLIMGTTNPAKIAQVRDALLPIGVRVEGVSDKKLLPEVIEDGTTVQENARKKATIYSKALGQTVFSMDNALFLDGLSTEDQPGLHVRRIGGTIAANDAELLAHGIELVKSLGGKATGYWEYGVCIAQPDGRVFETSLKTHRIFTSIPSKTIVHGFPLASIQIDPATSKYISEMIEREAADFWQRTLGSKLCEFVRSALA